MDHYSYGRIGDGDGSEGGGQGGKGKSEETRAADGGRPAKGERRPLTPFLHGHRLHRHLHHQFLLVYSGSSSHTPLYPSM